MIKENFGHVACGKHWRFGFWKTLEMRVESFGNLECVKLWKFGGCKTLEIWRVKKFRNLVENIGDLVCGKLEIRGVKNFGDVCGKHWRSGVRKTLEIWCVENSGKLVCGKHWRFGV